MNPFDRLDKALGGQTQRQFSEKTGVPQSQISQLHQRVRAPALAFIPALNRALGTTLEEWAMAAAELNETKRLKRAAKTTAKPAKKARRAA